MPVDWVTFDCYGTLIDWERGITDALLPLLPPGTDRRWRCPRVTATDRAAHRLGARDHRRLAAAVAAGNRSAGARRVVHRDGGAVREGGLSPLPGCARSRWPARLAVPRCSDTGRDDLAATVVARRLATL